MIICMSNSITIAISIQFKYSYNIFLLRTPSILYASAALSTALSSRFCRDCTYLLLSYSFAECILFVPNSPIFFLLFFIFAWITLISLITLVTLLLTFTCSHYHSYAYDYDYCSEWVRGSRFDGQQCRT